MKSQETQSRRSQQRLVMRRVIHKTCPTWGMTQCWKYLWPASRQPQTTYRWRDVTCQDCLKGKPHNEKGQR